VKHKVIPENHTVSMKVESELEIPLLNLCSLIYEIELYKEWVPFCGEAK
jgi:hypothetical protein